MGEYRSLGELCPGERGQVRALRLSGSMRRRLRDLGLVEGTEVACLGVSPLGDPASYQVRGAVLALRREDSGRIEVEVRQGGESGWA